MSPASTRLNGLGSDAGFRRYFYIEGFPQYLAVDAPPAYENTPQFVAIAEHLRAQQVRCPSIHAVDASLGFLIIENFGPHLLSSMLNDTRRIALYESAIDCLLVLQQAPDNPELIPRYDHTLLHTELMLFREWFIDGLLKHTLNDEDNHTLDTIFARIIEEVDALPQVFVHRDFHSRNLIVCDDNQLGVIDFQGALWGSCAYDLVSLLRDCYYQLPPHELTALRHYYYTRAIAAKQLPAALSEDAFCRGFDWTGLQRHIKVLGIFARLHLRDGKSHYLNDLPLVLHYVLDVAASYPELKDFVDLFRNQLLPIAKQQSWYRAIPTPHMPEPSL